MTNSEDRPDANVYSAILTSMLRIRIAEERISQLYSEQEMRCPTHLCIGQEAVPATLSHFLENQDLVFSGHRSHGHYLAKGGSLNTMFAELYGRATGCARGKGGSQHLVDLSCGFMGSAPILSSTISVGVGAAWAAQLDGKDQVTIVYFGDGATEEGTFHEALNFASVLKLPVIFVCENNLYSVHSSLDIRQPEGRQISAFGPAHAMPGERCDGNDVDAIIALAQKAITHAREGQGPFLIEAMTYRHKEHCGPGDDISLGYRTAQEVASWIEQDPINRLKGKLEDLQASYDYEAIVDGIHREVDEAVSFAKQSPFPAPEELDDHIFPAKGVA